MPGRRLRVDIDLDKNTVDSYYNGTPFSTRASGPTWARGHQLAIQAVDLYPDGDDVGVVYYDNMSLVPPPLFLEVDRDTGGLSLVNDTGAELDILGYSITSGAGALDQGGWSPISGNHDAPSNGGDGSVDSDDPWTILTAAGLHTDLSESELVGGDGGVVGVGDSIDFGGAWLKSPTEDLRMELLLASGERSVVSVKFVGNGGEPLASGDLNFDGAIDVDDWAAFLTGLSADLSGLSVVQAYQRGDLVGDDLDVNYADFLAFKAHTTTPTVPERSPPWWPVFLNRRVGASC